jgi:diguanylate cyclase
MWLDLIIAITCGGAGLVCGWIMHSMGSGNAASSTGNTNVNAIKEIAVPTEFPPEQLSEVAEHLRAYAYSMAADVDAHQSTVQAVSNQLTEQKEGSTDAVVHAINQLIEANERMQAQLHSAQERIHEQAVQIESAERRAETDALTRVPNRGAFDKHLSRQFALGPGSAGTLALLDVDHFKKFNDTYGHRAGDEVLRVVAGILHSRLHQYGIVARFGGEEFAMVLDGMSIHEAKDLVDEARAAIGLREISFEGNKLRVTASAGVAELTVGEAADHWLQRADEGLYRSKEVGRDCGHWMKGNTAIKIERSVATNGLGQPSGSPRAANGNAAPANKMIGNLPGRAEIGEAFIEVRDRTQSTASMFVMAIRCHGNANAVAMRSLMQIVKATLRSVDRLGCEDEATFLVFMPSIDEKTAHARGQQICQSAKGIGVGKADGITNPVTIGVSQVHANESFDDVATRCVDLVVDAADDDEHPVRISDGATLA